MNLEESVFIKNGSFYLLKKDKFESIERFNERGWFVVSIAPKNEDELNEAIRLSRIWSNMKFNKCTYDNILMDKISNIVNVLRET